MIMLVESLHLKHILIVSFQIHCGGVQSQNDENCVNVQIFMDLTVYTIIIYISIYRRLDGRLDNVSVLLSRSLRTFHSCLRWCVPDSPDRLRCPGGTAPPARYTHRADTGGSRSTPAGNGRSGAPTPPADKGTDL